MVSAIVGGNWGDEGKGKITDLLAGNADIIVRFQGGANAGHTIINEYGKFALHLLPSGVFRKDVVNIIGSYASPISLCISYLIGMAMEVCIVKKIITFKLEIGNLISFSIMYIISTFIYTSNNNLLSIIFFISATIIYLFIFKDFLITLKNNIANKKLNK